MFAGGIKKGAYRVGSFFVISLILGNQVMARIPPSVTELESYQTSGSTVTSSNTLVTLIVVGHPPVNRAAIMLFFQK